MGVYWFAWMGRAGDRALLEHAAELAKVHGAQLVLIRVGIARPWDAIVRETEQMEAYLAGLRDEFAQRGLEVQTVVAHGKPAKAILENAEALECDLVALSSHGHRWLMDLLLGSVSHAVRHAARVPVLLVRPEAADEGG